VVKENFGIFALQHASCSAETNSAENESFENVIDLPVYHTGVEVVVVVVVTTIIIMDNLLLSSEQSRISRKSVNCSTILCYNIVAQY
jgi:hypothetical protein